eukprot:TRINITY_DN22174_c0_g1_i1.p1 TRINITY_DN22174_c0_g1~~TRINITY_DN22174_c0_g1_i1.p1  ORF type:complete len:329 (+),score=59.84 TRINITY_DN22174_c0_g1_i1:171-1157(+)
MADAVPSYVPPWAAATPRNRGAAGRELRKGEELPLAAELGRRKAVPLEKLPGLRAPHLKLGGEPLGVGGDGETVPRLDRDRLGRGGARPAHRLLPGGVRSLTDVKTDIPNAGLQHTEAPVADELGLILKPWREQPHSSRAHVLAPYHDPGRGRRLRAAAAPIDAADGMKVAMLMGQAREQEALERGVQRSDKSASGRDRRREGSQSAKEETAQPKKMVVTIRASVDSSPVSTVMQLRLPAERTHSPGASSSRSRGAASIHSRYTVDTDFSRDATPSLLGVYSEKGSSSRATRPVALPPRPPAGPPPAQRRAGRMPLSPIIEYRLMPTM